MRLINYTYNQVIKESEFIDVSIISWTDSFEIRTRTHLIDRATEKSVWCGLHRIDIVRMGYESSGTVTVLPDDVSKVIKLYCKYVINKQKTIIHDAENEIDKANTLLETIK